MERNLPRGFHFLEGIALLLIRRVFAYTSAQKNETGGFCFQTSQSADSCHGVLVTGLLPYLDGCGRYAGSHRYATSVAHPFLGVL